jgi:pyridinium-3,5-bisthiocarboxylic acid mononucleotide nickel chelatase
MTPHDHDHHDPDLPDHDHRHDHDDHHHHHHDGDGHHPHPHSHHPGDQQEGGTRKRVTLLPGDPEAHRLPLDSSAAEGKVLYFDAASGIAGDMTVAALVDLGVPFSVVTESVAALELSGFRLGLSRAMSGALGATHFSVEETSAQPERRYRDVQRILSASRLAVPVRALSERIFEKLALAEASVHRVPTEDVTFHEVGAVDSIVDVVASAACLVHLGARVVSSPVPIGRGSVRTAHGVLPLPAPATLACLSGVPTVPADLDAELVTPTGAAILATIATSFGRWPTMVPSRVGMGAGTRAFSGRPNVLRVVLGEPEAVAAPSELVMLEANVDDMTGELSAHAIALLMSLGALDAFAAPVTMKKGRPGLVLSVLCRPEQAELLSATLLRETTSLGVRRVAVSRVERPRRVVEVATRFGTLPLKVSEGPYGPPQVKPEFDACSRAAAAAGVPVREVIAEALAAFARTRG